VWQFIAQAGDGRTVELQLTADMVPGSNTTVGADFNYHTSRLSEGRTLDLAAWVLASDSDASGRDTAAAVQKAVALAAKTMPSDSDLAVRLGLLVKEGKWYKSALLPKNFLYANLWAKVKAEPSLERKIVEAVNDMQSNPVKIAYQPRSGDDTSFDEVEEVEDSEEGDDKKPKKGKKGKK
jgi:hypothetical protein